MNKETIVKYLTLMEKNLMIERSQYLVYGEAAAVLQDYEQVIKNSIVVYTDPVIWNRIKILQKRNPVVVKQYASEPFNHYFYFKSYNVELHSPTFRWNRAQAGFLTTITEEGFQVQDINDIKRNLQTFKNYEPEYN